MLGVRHIIENILIPAHRLSSELSFLMQRSLAL